MAVVLAKTENIFAVKFQWWKECWRFLLKEIDVFKIWLCILDPAKKCGVCYSACCKSIKLTFK